MGIYLYIGIIIGCFRYLLQCMNKDKYFWSCIIIQCEVDNNGVCALQLREAGGVLCCKRLITVCAVYISSWW